MDNGKEFKRTVIILISLFFIMLSGHFSFVVGVIIFFLPIFYIVIKLYIDEARLIKLSSTVPKFLVCVRVVLIFILILCTLIFILSIMWKIEDIFFFTSFPLLMLIVSIANFIIELYLRRLIKKELSLKNKE